VRTELVPRLDDVRREWQSNHSSDESPDDHMQVLRDSFRALDKEFADDDDVRQVVEKETTRIDEWVAEHTDDESDDKPKRTLGDVDTSEEFDNSRSIFEDIDA
jgi:hypothetical protein